jgi:hypothetical protein
VSVGCIMNTNPNNLRMKIFFSCCILFFFATKSFAQFYESGQDPASIHWRQINTPHVRIIFPSGFDSAANKLANIYDYIYWNGSQSLNVSPRKISVVLHNYSCYSNGFVTLGPRRMELFTTPPQSFTAQDWLSELAVHEFRHVAQTAKVNQGITRTFYPFFGQLSSGLVSAMFPLWFAEGDAVYAETMLTNSGRGRTGDFLMQIKALLNDREQIFSFEKMLFGSYRDYIPDHYNTGYYLVSTIRKNYGSGVFDKSLNYVARNPFIPFSFSQGLKHETNKTARKLYKEVFDNLQQDGKNNIVEGPLYSTFCKSKTRGFTSFNYPQPVNDTTILAIKSGIDDIPKFVFLYRNGKEKTIFTLGSYSNTRISYGTDKIAWSEEIPDLRWHNRSFSCIKVFDLQTQSLKWLSHKSRYFSAALSRTGKNVATIEVSLENKAYLVVLDAKNGNIISRSLAPDNLMLADPVYAHDDQSIITVVSGNPGKALYRYSMSTGLWEQLTPFSFFNLSCPDEWNSYVIFSADYSGSNNLYAYRQSDQSLYKLTQIKIGAFEPFFHASDSVMYFSDYSSMGYIPKFFKTSPAIWGKYTLPPIYSDSLIMAGTRVENFNFQDSIMAKKAELSAKHEVKPYSKLIHAFNVHSWSPFYFDYNNLSLSNQSIHPGITLLSQDKLSTCISSLSFFNNNGTWTLKPRFIYKGWFPVLDLSVDYGGAIPYYKYFNKTAPYENGRISINSLIYIPFNLTRGKNICGIVPSLEIDYTNSRYFYTSDSSYRKGRTFASLGLNIYSYLKISERDIAPKIGFSLTAKYSYTPLDNVQFGYIAYIKPRIYLPGFLAHHSLQIAGAYQYQDPRIYLFSSQVPFVRGYTTGYTYKLLALWTDYSFPVWYPDIAIGPLIYFKRLRANLFYDFAVNQYKQYRQYKNSITYSWITNNYQSMGIDWLTDFHAFRIYFPFTAGIRTVYLPSERTVLNQFIMEMNFTF